MENGCLRQKTTPSDYLDCDCGYCKDIGEPDYMLDPNYVSKDDELKGRRETIKKLVAQGEDDLDTLYILKLMKNPWEDSHEVFLPICDMMIFENNKPVQLIKTRKSGNRVGEIWYDKSTSIQFTNIRRLISERFDELVPALLPYQDRYYHIEKNEMDKTRNRSANVKVSGKILSSTNMLLNFDSPTKLKAVRQIFRAKANVLPSSSSKKTAMQVVNPPYPINNTLHFEFLRLLLQSANYKEEYKDGLSKYSQAMNRRLDDLIDRYKGMNLSKQALLRVVTRNRMDELNINPTEEFVFTPTSLLNYLSFEEFFKLGMTPCGNKVWTQLRYIQLMPFSLSSMPTITVSFDVNR